MKDLKQFCFTFFLSLIIITPLFTINFLSTQPLYANSLRIKHTIELDSEIARFYYENFSKRFLFIPIGRQLSNSENITFYLNGEEIISKFETDDCGASWLNITLANQTANLEIIFDRVQPEATFDHFVDNGEFNISKWTSPTKFIDSDNETIRNLAILLIKDNVLILEKAQSIYDYVNEKIPYKDTKVPDLNASEVLNLGYGVCEDQARLFVALCRAVAIPARTISGFLAKDFLPFFSLHMWAEIRLEVGTWYSVCPTNGFFDFYDARFFDYVYSREESSFITPINSSSPILCMEPVNLKTQVIPISFSLNRVSVFLAAGIVSIGTFWVILIGIVIPIFYWIYRKINNKNYRNNS